MMFVLCLYCVAQVEKKQTRTYEEIEAELEEEEREAAGGDDDENGGEEEEEEEEEGGLDAEVGREDKRTEREGAGSWCACVCVYVWERARKREAAAGENDRLLTHIFPSPFLLPPSFNLLPSSSFPLPPSSFPLPSSYFRPCGILRTYLSGGTENLFHIGCTSCTVWGWSTTARYAATSRTGGHGPTTDTSRYLN